MPADSAGALRLTTARSSVTIRPAEGGAAVDLEVEGARVLARTPWAGEVVPHAVPAPDEDTWVSRWRGGWQVCLPWAGPAAAAGGAFHGDASQGAWHVVEIDAARAVLAWHDRDGLRAGRTWTLHDDGLSAHTVLAHAGSAERAVIVTEHLVLGGDLLDTANGELGVDLGAGHRVQLLEYDGSAGEQVVEWPEAGWRTVGPTTGPRLAAVLAPHPTAVAVAGGPLEVRVAWEGLEHLLLWDEPGDPDGPPTFRGVRALGVEPSTTAHGAGPAGGGGLVHLAPGDELSWRVRLTVVASDTDHGGDLP